MSLQYKNMDYVWRGARYLPNEYSQKMLPSQAIPSSASPTSEIFTKVVMPREINKDSQKTQRFAANCLRFRPRIPDYRRRIAPKSFLNTVDNSFKGPIARNGLDESADTVLNRHKKTKIEPFNPLPTLNKTTLPVFDGLLKISFNAFLRFARNTARENFARMNFNEFDKGMLFDLMK